MITIRSLSWIHADDASFTGFSCPLEARSAPTPLQFWLRHSPELVVNPVFYLDSIFDHQERLKFSGGVYDVREDVIHELMAKCIKLFRRISANGLRRGALRWSSWCLGFGHFKNDKNSRLLRAMLLCMHNLTVIGKGHHLFIAAAWSFALDMCSPNPVSRLSSYFYLDFLSLKVVNWMADTILNWGSHSCYHV